MTKKLLTAGAALLTALSLSAVAYADIVWASPGVIAASLAMEFLPWILTAAAAAVSAFLLFKFWKKKK